MDNNVQNVMNEFEAQGEDDLVKGEAEVVSF